MKVFKLFRLFQTIDKIHIYCFDQNPYCGGELPEAELGAVGARQHTLPLLGNLQVPGTGPGTGNLANTWVRSESEGTQVLATDICQYSVPIWELTGTYNNYTATMETETVKVGAQMILDKDTHSTST